MKKTYAVLNLMIAILVIVWNGLSNSGIIGGKTVGDVSDDLYNLFTPAGYAFAIWGIIFLGLIVNGVYQVYIAYKGAENELKYVLTGPWLIIANIANGVWIWFWLNEYVGISVLIMIVLLLALLRAALDTRIQKEKVSRSVLVLAWWPVSLYLGWISVALIANVAAFLSQIGWADSVNEELFTIIMILVAIALNLFVLFNRNMSTFCWVGVWALLAIAARSEIMSIYYTAFYGAILLGVITGAHILVNLGKGNTVFYAKDLRKSQRRK